MKKLNNQIKDEICKDNKWIVTEICEEELNIKDEDIISSIQELINYSTIIDDIYDLYKWSDSFEEERRSMIKKEIEAYKEDLERDIE